MSAMYNSSVGQNQDDSDITIINPSILHENNDEPTDTYVPILQRLQPNRSSTNDPSLASSDTATPTTSRPVNGEDRDDYIFVDHDRRAAAKQLLQVLALYRNDLKQESNTQLDCSRQLITRIIDLIRPAYSSNSDEMIGIENLNDEIACLHDKRYVEQKEKLEQLHTEICHLHRTLLSTTNDERVTLIENTKMISNPNTITGYDLNVDDNQWTEMEAESKRLQEIVQNQRNQINELITLMSYEGTAPSSLHISQDTMKTVFDAAGGTAAPGNSILLEKLRALKDRRENAAGASAVLDHHSPGISPSHSLASLITQALEQPADDPPPIETNEEPEKQHEIIDIPLPAPVPVVEPKKCPVCNHIFAATVDDLEMYNHVEKCLFPPGTAVAAASAPAVVPKHYECPQCSRKLPGDDEPAYLQHLSDCYNRDIADNF